jgi:hypothetical protein
MAHDRQNRVHLEARWTVALPHLAIFTMVLSVALIGDGVNYALDPRRQDDGLRSLASGGRPAAPSPVEPLTAARATSPWGRFMPKRSPMPR